MAVALVILSFTCAGFLAVFVPVKRVRTSVPHLAIVLWLVGHNLIHAINAAVWAGNVDIHVPVWCDIVTKVLLGIKVALPGAFVCIASQLELTSSQRKASMDKRVLRNRMIFELFLCYVFPILYMLLHFVIQDRRFDLVKDYGCSASSHPSTLAFLITWLPPLIICSIALILSGVSIHNSGRVVGVSLNTHLETRSTLTASQFNRQLSTCMIMAGALALISLATLFSVHSFESWTSWSSVHALITKIEIVKSASDIKNVQFAWWSMFGVSVLYIILSYVIGEEGREVYRWIGEQVKRKRELPRVVLPLHFKQKQSPPEMISRSSSLTKSHLRPLTIELKSGWDDILEDKESKRKGFREDTKSPSPTFSPTHSTQPGADDQSLLDEKIRPDSPLIPCVSPATRAITEDDQMFMESTISYLSSPTAKTLGIVPPLQVPPAAKSSPPHLAVEIPPKPTSSPAPKPKSILKSPRSPPSKPVPTDINEPIGSVFDTTWPVPPISPVPTMAFSSKHAPRARSRSHSPGSAEEEMIGYASHPTINLPYRRISMTYPNAIFSAFAFIGFLMCSIPFPWHLEAWNTGTCLYMAWTGLSCLNQFVNSIIWNRNAINWSPTWCDISSRFIVGSAVAIPAASLCINRRLYHISSVRSVTISKAEKRRDVMVDLSIGLGIPLLEMILQYIVQGHRFNIFEDVGCYPFTYNTWPAYILVFCPPVAIGVVSAVYAILSIIQFNKSRSQFNDLLSGHNNLTSSRYVRLMCLAGIEVLCTVPIGSYALYLNAGHGGIRPWISWADTHYAFSRVDQFPAVLWRTNRVSESSIELTRWLVIVCAFIFFGFFGFADEARKNYRSYMQSVAKRVGISTASFGNSSGVFSSTGSKVIGSNGKVRPVLPTFVHQDFLRRHDSLDSFTDISSASIRDVSGFLNEKGDAEKQEAFNPILSYGGLTLSDVGGTLNDCNAPPYSPAPSLGASSASSLTKPEPARTRSSSIASTPSSQVPVLSEPKPKSNTPDIV
ncbi:hypothetical protein CVT25_006649 [Psilocybe cyanescens]|uniref:G-protein coupled receptors family 1 profile domain-containing protein n=1 Tax=Psilocybe cyanescens TaxID=93625 RepID=A0A409XTT8_PSICY|nr:hypothetical protein CVT25_006649 [Psilocybe cyanescens]